MRLVNGFDWMELGMSQFFPDPEYNAALIQRDQQCTP